MIEQKLRESCGTADPLALTLRGGAVRRYHAEGELIRQDVAQHSWRCAVILLHLWPESSAALLAAAINHDAAEVYVGDLPAPVKRDASVHAALGKIEDEVHAFLGMPQISEEEELRLKVADYLEGYLTCKATNSPRSMQIAATFSVYVRELAIMLSDVDRLRVYSMLGMM